MSEPAQAMVMASLLADSLALGAHWIYDTEQIRQRFGRVDELLAPGPGSHHPNRKAGEFTHYGDQTLLLLETLAIQGGFDLRRFCTAWQAMFASYDGYVDQATRGTLERFSAGFGPDRGGSGSSDLAGAARIAPLVYLYRDDLETLAQAARAQTRMTHNHPLPLGAADFFARVCFRVLHGSPPVPAIRETVRTELSNEALKASVEAGLDTAGEDTVEVIARFGQSCHAEEAFPGVIHLIATYEKDLEEALVQAVMAGGDSAARGMLVGMVLGAYLGMEAIPGRWLAQWKKRQDVLDLLGRCSSP